VINKLRAEDGSEIFARRISGNTNESLHRSIAVVDNGDRLLLSGVTFNHAEGFGSHDILVGACTSDLETDYALVYEDTTPTMTDETYESA
jgi:hypothetical protein